MSEMQYEAVSVSLQANTQVKGMKPTAILPITGNQYIRLGSSPLFII